MVSAAPFPAGEPRRRGEDIPFPLTAAIRRVGVGADQQRDVQLLGRVGDGEDNLGESEETAASIPPRRGAPSPSRAPGDAQSRAGSSLRHPDPCGFDPSRLL